MQDLTIIIEITDKDTENQPRDDNSIALIVTIKQSVFFKKFELLRSDNPAPLLIMMNTLRDLLETIATQCRRQFQFKVRVMGQEW